MSRMHLWGRMSLVVFLDVSLAVSLPVSLAIGLILNSTEICGIGINDLGDIVTFL